MTCQSSLFSEELQICIRQAASHETLQHWVGLLRLAIAPDQVIPGTTEVEYKSWNKIFHSYSSINSCIMPATLYRAAISRACGWWATAILQQCHPENIKAVCVCHRQVYRMVEYVISPS